MQVVKRFGFTLALAFAAVPILAATAGATTHITPPGAPTGVSATSNANAASVVSWSAPTSQGGAPITSYSVRFSSNGGRTWKSVASSGTTPHLTVTGISNGTSYIFGVAAKNTGGKGSYSTSSSAATPATVPSVPTRVRALGAQDSKSSVSWSAPSITGGTAVTGYTVTSSPDAHICRTTSTSCTVKGLTNGTSYTFSVTATNAAGSSLSSVPTSGVIPSMTPGGPINLTATAAQNQRVTLHWTAPSDLGGAPSLVGYSVQYSSDAGTTWTSASPNAGATATSYTVNGLTNGTPYVFMVTARNPSGFGVPATSNVVTPSTVTDPPSGVSATMSDHGATVSWAAPTATGGASVTGYNVKVISAAGGRTQQFNSTTPTEDISGLIDGVSYTFMVQAVNASGPSAFSTVSGAIVPAGLPGAPTNVTVIGSTWADNNASATVWWKTGPSNGSDITGYAVTATDAADSANDATCTTYGSHDPYYGRQCTVTGLAPGDPYSFTVVATNGLGVASTSTAGTVTGVSTSLVSAGSVAVTWTDPTSGLTPVSYLVKANDAAATTCSVAFGTNTCTLNNGDLTSLAGFSVTVQAVDAFGGLGLAGFITSAPAAPAAPVVAGANGALLVSWAPVTTTPVASYTATVSDETNPGTNGDGNVCFLLATNAPSCAITGLTNGDVYTVTVVATNTFGQSASSLASSDVMPSTVPSAPTNVVVVDNGDGSSTISWTASSSGGSPVTGYTVTAKDLTSPGVHGDGSTCTSNDPTDSCTISGMTEGDSYIFSVIATNADGNGAPAVGVATP